MEFSFISILPCLLFIRMSTPLPAPSTTSITNTAWNTNTNTNTAWNLFLFASSLQEQPIFSVSKSEEMSTDRNLEFTVRKQESQSPCQQCLYGDAHRRGTARVWGLRPQFVGVCVPLPKTQKTVKLLPKAPCPCRHMPVMGKKAFGESFQCGGNLHRSKGMPPWRLLGRQCTRPGLS